MNCVEKYTELFTYTVQVKFGTVRRWNASKRLKEVTISATQALSMFVEADLFKRQYEITTASKLYL